MPAVKKEVIRPTRVHPFVDEPDVPFDIDFDRIQRWANNLATTFSRGYKLPIPNGHLEEAVPTKDGQVEYDNLGFFTGVELEKDGTLWLTGDVEDDSRLDELPFVSLKSVEEWDGLEDAIVHVAATKQPHFGKQSEWQETHSIALSLAMPQTDPNTDPSGKGNSIESCLKLLRDLGVELRDDIISPDEFLSELCTALRAVSSYKKMEEGDEAEDQRPEGSKVEKPAPIAMSKTEQTILGFALELAGKDNPATGKPYTEEEIRAQYKAKNPPVELHPAEKALHNAWRKRAVERLAEAVKDGTLSTKAAEEVWLPRIKSVPVQLADDGSIKPNAVSTMLDLLESLAPGHALTNRDSLELAADRIEADGLEAAFASHLKLEKRPAEFEEGGATAQQYSEEKYDEWFNQAGV